MLKLFHDLKHIFGQMDMSWKTVILAAVISGAATGLINMIPFLRDTSFDDIAHNFEAWIILGIWVICNCKSPKEAANKVFIFFLISQPLVYLVESPVFGLQIFKYYPFWFGLTLLTWPAGYMSWYMGRESWMGAVAMFGAEALLIMEGVQYLFTCINQFPRQLLAVIFCFGSALLIPILFYTKKKRLFLLIAAEIPVLLLCMSLANITQDFRRLDTTYVIPGHKMGFNASTWTATSDQNDFYHISGVEGNFVKISALTNAPVPGEIICRSSDGQKITLKIEVKDGVIHLEEVQPAA